ncbi:hypothetical protein EV421DRAFT_1745174 [Armillaria borealis]|uniref:Uncharacterized protein n=1 Tax=Armillaria borealis TaxID=47425 RepID=A0AA39MDH1_9AGAR|nr:hypothetical protein EV421DRAFT_1745174 [Armillaria borealis]
MAAFQSDHHRLHLFNYCKYIAGHYFSEAFGWKNFSGNGHILTLIEALEGREVAPEASLIIVDRVGGWKSKFRLLKNAKFSLTLGGPRDAGFAKDWEITISQINSTIACIGGAGGERTRSCIQKENDCIQLQFSTPIFEPLSPDAMVMDKVIQTWQVDSEHQSNLDTLK